MNDPDYKPSPWDDVVRYVTANPDGLTIAQLAKKLDIPQHLVSKWRKEGLEDGIKPGKGVRSGVARGRKRRVRAYASIPANTIAGIKNDTRDAATVAKAHGVSVATVYNIRGGRPLVVDAARAALHHKNVWALMTKAERAEAWQDSARLTPKQFFIKWHLSAKQHEKLRAKAKQFGLEVCTDPSAPHDIDRHHEWAREITQRYNKVVAKQVADKLQK